MLASLALRRSLLPVSTVTTQLAVVRPVPFVFTAHYGTAKPAPPKGKPAQPAADVAKKVVPTKVVAKPPPPPPKGSRAEKIEKQKEQERAAKEKQKEKERAAKDKAKEKEQQQKEKEKEKAHKDKLKEKEQQQKEKEKERLLKEKAKEKEQQQKEKEKANKEKLKEKEKEQKEKDKAHALKEKEKEKKQELSETRKAEKLRKDDYPTRSKSPYIYFTLELRDKVIKEMPNLKFTEVMTELGKRWTALPDNARVKYEKLAQQDKVRFDKELAQFKIKYPDPPKRGLSAYTFFVTSYTATVRKEHPDYSVTQVLSTAAQKWKSLSANERKKYDDMAAKDKERYAKERAKFDKLVANKQ